MNIKISNSGLLPKPYEPIQTFSILITENRINFWIQSVYFHNIRFMEV